MIVKLLVPRMDDFEFVAQAHRKAQTIGAAAAELSSTVWIVQALGSQLSPSTEVIICFYFFAVCSQLVSFIRWLEIPQRCLMKSQQQRRCTALWQ